MRYYIIDNKGNVFGESENKEKCEMILHDCYTNSEIEWCEMEVICDD